VPYLPRGDLLGLRHLLIAIQAMTKGLHPLGGSYMPLPGKRGFLHVATDALEDLHRLTLVVVTVMGIYAAHLVELSALKSHAERFRFHSATT
jgi:hypothetical protein